VRVENQIQKKGGENLKQSNGVVIYPFCVMAKTNRQLSDRVALPRDKYALLCDSAEKIVLNA